MPGTATHTPFPPITFHRASPTQPPSSSALGHQTHRDRARLLLQQPEHLRRDPPPLKAAPGLGPACIPLQNDKTSRKTESARSRDTCCCARGTEQGLHFHFLFRKVWRGMCSSQAGDPQREADVTRSISEALEFPDKASQLPDQRDQEMMPLKLHPSN